MGCKLKLQDECTDLHMKHTLHVHTHTNKLRLKPFQFPKESNGGNKTGRSWIKNGGRITTSGFSEKCKPPLQLSSHGAVVVIDL